MAYIPIPTFLLTDQSEVWLIPIYCSCCWSGNFPKAGDCQILKLHITCWRKKQALDLPDKKKDVVTPSWKWTKLLSCSSLKSFFRSALLVLPWLCDNMSSSWSWTSFQTEQLIIKSHQQEKDHATSWKSASNTNRVIQSLQAKTTWSTKISGTLQLKYIFVWPIHVPVNKRPIHPTNDSPTQNSPPKWRFKCRSCWTSGGAQKMRKHPSVFVKKPSLVGGDFNPSEKC